MIRASRLSSCGVFVIVDDYSFYDPYDPSSSCGSSSPHPTSFGYRRFVDGADVLSTLRRRRRIPGNRQTGRRGPRRDATPENGLPMDSLRNAVARVDSILPAEEDFQSKPFSKRGLGERSEACAKRSNSGCLEIEAMLALACQTSGCLEIGSINFAKAHDKA